MTRPLHVLVIESTRQASASAVAALEAAGHIAHRCHDELDNGFPCRGVVDAASCPLDSPIDAALVVRPRITPRVTPLEDGVTCAIRAGVPVVELGPDVLDPFEPWLSGRVHREADVVQGCVDVTEASLEPMRTAILDRIGAIAAGASIPLTSIGCRIERLGWSLAVHLDLPVAVSRGVEQALAVRVLDAVQSLGRTVGNVDVHVHHRPSGDGGDR